MIWSAPIVEGARRGEAGVLAEIHAAAFRRTWSALDFSALIADPSVFALVARQKSLFGRRRIAGFVVVRFAADEAEILTIAVRPKLRKRGIGRLLMHDVIRRLYRERIASLFLEVEAGNAAAVALYRKLGFAVAGGRKNYYSEPAHGDPGALVMRLQVR